MIDRENCTGKYKIFYKELEKRVAYLGTSIDDLKSYGCTITDNPGIIDCVLGINTHTDECGMMTTRTVRKYIAYHFAIKRSTQSLRHPTTKDKVLVTASWLEDMINYWRLNIKSHEHMIFVMMYNDLYYMFDIETLATKYGFETKKIRDTFTKYIPCFNPKTNTKELNRVLMIPVHWAEIHGYLTPKKERDKIYRNVDNHTSDNPRPNIQTISPFI